MVLRFGALLAAAFVAVPAHAQQMNAAEARSFVVGKMFSYQCFEGTRGAGRIMENGAVAGTIQFRGDGGTRYAVLPANTLRVVGDRVCATVKGLPFEPCFNLIKTSASSFRGSLSGLGFAYCDFTRRDRPMVASAAPRSRAARSRDEDAGPSETSSVRLPDPKPAEARPVETKPVEAKELPATAGDGEPLKLRSTTE